VIPGISGQGTQVEGGFVIFHLEEKQCEREVSPEKMTFVAGLLHTRDRTIPMRDMDKSVAHCIQPDLALAGEAKG